MQLRANKEKYNKEIPLSFEVVSTKSSSLDANQFSSITELLPELKKQIEKDNAAGASSLKYAIFYRLPSVTRDSQGATQNPPLQPTSKQPSPESTANCTITPTTTITQPNWYGVIEIGAKGIKPIAVHFEHNGQGKLQPNDFNNTFGTQDVTPSEEVSIPRVVQAVCENINQFHHLYGNLPVYLVGSSSMANVPHRAKLVAAIEKSIQLPIDFITADQEASYLARGIWAPPLPVYRRCESAVIDIGSGNIKGGYLQDCNPKVEKTEKEKFVSFDIQEFGTANFSKQTQQKVDDKTFPTFVEAAKNTREELEKKLDEQVRTRPELTNGKERMYLVGGAVWIVNTLLCLDCPQYNGRPETRRDQDEYTVIRPADIEEFYHYVTQEGEKVCDFSQENPYLRRSMDGKYNTPWDESRIEKQKVAIQNVCKKFQAPRDLISAAEILRAIKNKMGINENRHIFFMQNNLYTWSRQYLIDKIQ